MHRRIVLVGLATAIMAGLAAAPAPSLMHLRLKRTEPAADTTLTTAPKALRFWFSEAPDLALFTTRLTAAGGTAVALARPKFESEKPDAPVVVGITGPVTRGSYTVAWKAMADDGHAVSGEFGFTIAP